MKTIRNKTTRPLRVPLPRGHVLHLQPRKEGEIADGAEEHPPLVKLVEAGEIEILGEGEHEQKRPGDEAGPVSTQGQHHAELTSHHRGER